MKVANCFIKQVKHYLARGIANLGGGGGGVFIKDSYNCKCQTWNYGTK